MSSILKLIQQVIHKGSGQERTVTYSTEVTYPFDPHPGLGITLVKKGARMQYWISHVSFLFPTMACRFDCYTTDVVTLEGAEQEEWFQKLGWKVDKD